jgi:hypothetical protein
MKKDVYAITGLPVAKNGMSSRAAFIQRRNYNFFVEAIVKENIDVELLDLRGDFKDFLKFDNKDNIVNISETCLKNIDNDKYVVNFVADAFEELKLLCKNSKIITEKKLQELKPKKGWESLHKKYHDHLTTIFQSFTKFILETKRDKNILNFDNFIVEFVNYLNLVAFKIPILKSSYFLSKDYNISNLGFCIEIDTIKKDKDKDKFTKFFQSYSFKEFAKLCKKTNFAIDQDCPWRLIYLPFSDLSQKYMSTYNVNKNTFFQQYFYKTEDFDLENLKNYMVIFYNSFVEKEPTAHSSKIINYLDKTMTVTQLTDRNPLTIEQVDNKYDDLFWFTIYSHIKIVENKLKLNNEQYKFLIKNLNQKFKLSGKNSAMNELKQFILNSEYVETRDQFNFELPPFKS